MSDASQYTSRRASAAAAAEAHAVVPINSRGTRNKRKESAGGGDVANRARTVRPPRRPPPAPIPDANGRFAVLQAQGEIDADETYGEQEKALSEFLKLHPMLSLCAAATPLLVNTLACQARLQGASAAHRPLPTTK
jgi:hypothetical protein